MFGIGMPELILILVVGLVVIGPKKLPELARSLGRAIGEFKKATREFRETLNVEEELREVREVQKELKQTASATWEDFIRADDDAPDSEKRDKDDGRDSDGDGASAVTGQDAKEGEKNGKDGESEPGAERKP